METKIELLKNKIQQYYLGKQSAQHWVAVADDIDFDFTDNYMVWQEFLKWSESNEEFNSLTVPQWAIKMGWKVCDYDGPHINIYTPSNNADDWETPPYLAEPPSSALQYLFNVSNGEAKLNLDLNSIN
jgi:hypothetical protein